MPDLISIGRNGPFTARWGARLRGDRPGDRAYHGIRLAWLSIDGERTQGLMHRGTEGRTWDLEWGSEDRNRHH